jgi:hypothetical protein
MTVSSTNGVSLGNLVSAETDPLTGGIELLAGGKDVIAAAGILIKNQAVFIDDPIGNQLGGAGAAGYTWYGKRQVPCDFDAVQLVIGQNLTTTPTVKAIVAVTETAAVDTDANRYMPISGGAPFNVLDAAEQVGWRSVTWGGAATATFGANASRSQFARDFLTSDIIPLSSIPRADGGNGRLLMWRVYASVDTISFIGVTPLATPDATTHGDMILQASYRSAVDATTSLASTPGGITNSSLFMGVVLYSRGKAIGVIGIGDSITQQDGLVSDKVSSWGQRAAQLLIAQGKNVGWINAGCSGYPSATYLPQGKAQISTYKPHVAVYAAWTPNDISGFTTEAQIRGAIQTMAGRTIDFLAHCRTNGVYPILNTGIPDIQVLNTAAKDNLRKAFVARIREMANKGLCGLLDMDALISDGASPANIKAAYQVASESPNFVHINVAGTDVVAAELARVLGAVI